MYFDHCATTPTAQEVVAAMQPYWREVYGNPSSLHQAGRKAAAALQVARQQVAALVHAGASEILFTSGATEANNMALQGVLPVGAYEELHLITTSIEHHAVLHTMQAMEKRGARVTYLPVDELGLISIEDLQDAIRPETRLISVMHVNNEVGSIQPIAKVAQIAHAAGALLHVDAVQGVGLWDVDVHALGIDLLSISAHKMYGPKGVGALFLRKGLSLEPLMYGGAQEKTLRPGTENVPGIVGFGKAAELIAQHREEYRAHIVQLRSTLIKFLLEKVPTVIVNGPEDPLVSPHVLSLTFPGCVAEMMQIQLAMQGIAISLGSACNSQEINPSHVLMAMGLSREAADATIRVSFGKDNTLAEVHKFAEVLAQVAGACTI